MTENDAKSKWCPMARTTFAEYPPGNRDFSHGQGGIAVNANPEYARCIASECACWVWDGNNSFVIGHCGLAR